MTVLGKLRQEGGMIPQPRISIQGHRTEPTVKSATLLGNGAASQSSKSLTTSEGSERQTAGQSTPDHGIESGRGILDDKAWTIPAVVQDDPGRRNEPVTFKVGTKDDVTAIPTPVYDEKTMGPVKKTSQRLYSLRRSPIHASREIEAKLQ